MRFPRARWAPMPDLSRRRRRKEGSGEPVDEVIQLGVFFRPGAKGDQIIYGVCPESWSRPRAAVTGPAVRIMMPRAAWPVSAEHGRAPSRPHSEPPDDLPP